MTFSILSAIADQCDRTPNAPAITAGGTLWTYRTLRRQIAARSAAYGHRMRPGAVTAIAMVPEPEPIAQVLAVAGTGRTPVLLPAGLPGWEERDMLRDSGAAYFVARGMTLPLGEEAPPGETFPGGMMQLTSGSMGPSRPAFRTWEGVSQEIESLITATGLSRRDTVLVMSPLAHSYGFMAGVLAPLSVGAHVVVAREGPADLSPAGISVVLGLPATYEGWLSRYEAGALRAVRLAFSAGAPLPAGLYDDIRSRFGVALRQDYGTTETGTVSLDMAIPPNPLTVGTVLPHLACRVVGENEREGEIEVRGAAVALGYVREGRLVSCTDAEGWYHTLDLGTLTPDGLLRLTGRRQLPLRAGKDRIHPEELEADVLTLPGAREAVVLEAADADGIKVVVTGDIRQDDLDRWRHHTADRLGVPITVQRRPSLPRSPAGKVLRKYLLSS